jgi:transposase-like protein
MRRHYSDKDRAEILAVLKGHGGNVSRTAKDTGAPERTIAGWAASEKSRANAAPADLRAQKEAELSEAWAEVRDKAIKRANEALDRGEKLGLRDLTILAGVATDKTQLLSGKATDRLEVTSLAEFLRAAPGQLVELHKDHRRTA